MDVSAGRVVEVLRELAGRLRHLLWNGVNGVVGAAHDEPFWNVTPQDAMAALKSGPDGLSAADAAARLARLGPNVAVAAPKRRIGLMLAKRLAEPLVAILLIAAVVSGLTGDLPSFFIIVGIVVISVGLDVFQEHRAGCAVDALRRQIAIHATVRRAGAPTEVPVEHLVEGDIVELKAGDLVPADGIVLESRGAFANEALLTGEPYPVEKRQGPSGADDPSGAYDALFGGTALVAGEARMLVLSTGARTRFGGIAAALESEQPPTAFERGIHALGILIVRMTVFLVAFVLLIHLAFHRPPLESFLFAVALAVGLTPELLPMVTTVTLSRGAVRLAGKQVIVKRLAAIHDLGAMDVLCTDKTGTLTQARIELAGATAPDGTPAPEVERLAAVNARLATGVKTALDEAVLAGADTAVADGWQRIADLPFDFERRRASVLAEHAGERLLLVKGAPEHVLALSTAAGMPDGPTRPLDELERDAIAAEIEAETHKGLRLIAVAWRRMPSTATELTADDETDLVLAGFCAFADPPKPSTRLAVEQLAGQNVRLKILSGDSAGVVQHLIGELSLPLSGVLTGTQIAGMTDASLAARVDEVDVYARVSPEQKMRVIRALQQRGHTVGFVGDGINDAPAIKAADCGLSVDSASDVARAAADIILLQPDLGVLSDGVEEGRRTYANITKYVRMGTSSNFGNMLSMALASLFIPFLPLTASQILVNNLLYDLSETGIPFDNVDRSDVATPHGWDMGAVLRFTLVMGPLSSLFDIATFTVLLWGFSAPPEVFRTAWFVESISTQVLVIFLIRTAYAPWSSRPHPVLTFTSLSALAVGLFLALGPFAGWLGFGPMPWPLLLAVAALVVCYLALAEFAKRWAIKVAGKNR